MINTVIFDLDGTLLNTIEDLTDSVNYALSQKGYPKRTIDEVRSFVGNGVKRLIDLAVPIETLEEDKTDCLSLFRKHYNEHSQNKTKPYEDILSLLSKLKELDVKLAVVSNKYDEAVKVLCNEFYSEYITVAIGESFDVARKPAPDSVYKALTLLKSKTTEALYVGDSEVDVATAHNASLPCIGVTWGFRSKNVLKNAGADIIIDKPLELLNHLT